MKKIIFMLVLFSIGLYSMGQNSLRTEGVSDSVIINGGNDVTATGTITLPAIPGNADWSLLIMPAKGAVLTSDSVYATVKVFVSNTFRYFSSRSVWAEPRAIVSAIVTAGAGGTPSIGHYYPLRDTLANTTVALSPGLLIEGKSFQNSMMKVQINRPLTQDTVSYKIYYVYKYPQTNPQR